MTKNGFGRSKTNFSIKDFLIFSNLTDKPLECYIKPKLIDLSQLYFSLKLNKKNDIFL